MKRLFHLVRKNVHAIYAVVILFSVTSCATTSQKMESPYPVQNIVFVWSAGGDPISYPIPVQDSGASKQNIDEDSAYRLAKRSYDLPTDSKKFPAPLVNQPYLTNVISTGWSSGYMVDPLCSGSPTIHVYNPSVRWGPIWYENWKGERDRLLMLLREAIKINCTSQKPDLVQIAAFARTSFSKKKNGKYLDDGKVTAKEGEAVARYEYYGAVFSEDDYGTLWHDDPDGLKRYYKRFKREERRYKKSIPDSSLKATSSTAVQKSETNSIADFCESNKKICTKIIKRAQQPLIFQKPML